MQQGRHAFIMRAFVVLDVVVSHCNVEILVPSVKCVPVQSIFLAILRIFIYRLLLGRIPSGSRIGAKLVSVHAGGVSDNSVVER